MNIANADRRKREYTLPELCCTSSIVQLSMVAQLFAQLTGLVYQILLHVTEFTHCV